MKTNLQSIDQTHFVKETEIEEMFATALPNAFLWYKNLKSIYQCCNENHAAAAGLDSAQQMLGKNDFDMCWQNRAGQYQQTDNRVMSEKIVYVNEIEKVTTVHTELTMLVTKYPVINNSGEFIGVCGVNIDITGQALIKKSGRYDPTKKVFYLTTTSKTDYLTQRELDVLKFLLYGRTAKEIGLQLRISYRTVETHINLIKEKLGCRSKSEIISKALNLKLACLFFNED